MKHYPQRYSRPTDEKVQEAFDGLFPDHCGHYLEYLCPLVCLSFGFICSCGAEIKVPAIQEFTQADNPFIEYHRDIRNGANVEMKDMFEKCQKFGFIAIDGELLSKFVNRCVKAGIDFRTFNDLNEEQS